MLTLLSFFMS